MRDHRPRQRRPEDRDSRGDVGLDGRTHASHLAAWHDEVTTDD